ncbi:MAG TPA: hypothetical protein VN694_06680 [Caulobacteraceae bacterium]|nr:hypothetical protein [Caulobacteraceae bacterium]
MAIETSDPAGAGFSRRGVSTAARVSAAGFSMGAGATADPAPSPVSGVASAKRAPSELCNRNGKTARLFS